jgi:hypothetical protein
MWVRIPDYKGVCRCLHATTRRCAYVPHITAHTTTYAYIHIPLMFTFLIGRTLSKNP